MERLAIIGLATVVTVPLIYALKKHLQSSELAQEEEEEEEDLDLENVEMPEYEAMELARFISIVCAALVVKRLYSREIFYKIMIIFLERMQPLQ
ncbi:GL25298 [Drosophila persimilis]|uniref:GL25298 n=1 Tax=Drosophila persimilis TaxID=7234 RepID=B4GU40_DROPE|nr:GL25298 [Drosophila persimilis]